MGLVLGRRVSLRMRVSIHVVIWPINAEWLLPDGTHGILPRLKYTDILFLCTNIFY